MRVEVKVVERAEDALLALDFAEVWADEADDIEERTGAEEVDFVDAVLLERTRDDEMLLEAPRDDETLLERLCDDETLLAWAEVEVERVELLDDTGTLELRVTLVNFDNAAGCEEEPYVETVLLERTRDDEIALEELRDDEALVDRLRDELTVDRVELLDAAGTLEPCATLVDLEDATLVDLEDAALLEAGRELADDEIAEEGREDTDEEEGLYDAALLEAWYDEVTLVDGLVDEVLERGDDVAERVELWECEELVEVAGLYTGVLLEVLRDEDATAGLDDDDTVETKLECAEEELDLTALLLDRLTELECEALVDDAAFDDDKDDTLELARDIELDFEDEGEDTLLELARDEMLLTVEDDLAEVDECEALDVAPLEVEVDKLLEVARVAVLLVEWLTVEDLEVLEADVLGVVSVFGEDALLTAEDVELCAFDEVDEECADDDDCELEVHEVLDEEDFDEEPEVTVVLTVDTELEEVGFCEVLDEELTAFDEEVLEPMCEVELVEEVDFAVVEELPLLDGWFVEELPFDEVLATDDTTLDETTEEVLVVPVEEPTLVEEPELEDTTFERLEVDTIEWLVEGVLVERDTLEECELLGAVLELVPMRLDVVDDFGAELLGDEATVEVECDA
ncbi:hypothetical protein HK405_003591 [Cladochytrium tenue]|nr:hypothetical protein HK405_003591 [Cladochytrium tenue]